MAELVLQDVPRKTRDLFDKATAAVDRGNYDYAMDMLIAILEQEPRFLQARKSLRAVQLKKAAEAGGGPGALSSTLSGLGAYLSAQMVLAKSPLKALTMGEKLMRRDPSNPLFNDLMIRAALAADLPEVAVNLLEIMTTRRPDDVPALMKLGGLYVKVGDTGNARACFERLLKLRPNDPAILKALKDAQAVDTMKQGRWTDAKSYRDVIRNTEEAKLLEQQAKAVKTTADVESLISEYRERLEKEPQNVNYRRMLGDLLARAGQFDDAIALLEETSRMSGGGDPQVDRALSQVRLQKFDAEIAALREAGNEAGAAEAEKARADFVFADTADRVRRYPNDLQFKFEFGVQLFDRGQVNEAIQQFQHSQRNPQRRIRSLYYMARCFEQKGQLDIAADQLEKASSELTLMDDNKKDIIYELGVIYEQLGKKDKAGECFKQIYSVDIGFRDVAAKIESLYKS